MILVDYNPRSRKLDLSKLRELPFAKQVKVFFIGFAMWQQNVRPVSDYQAGPSGLQDGVGAKPGCAPGNQRRTTERGGNVRAEVH